MKEVLFISYYFPPMGGAGVQRSAKFVKYLPEFGWRPIVITAAPDTYSLHQEFQLDRTVGAGLNKSNHEVYYLFDPEPRRLRRMLERTRTFPALWFLLFPLFWEPQILWALCAIWRGLRILKQRQIEVIYTTSGPYCTVLTGLALKFITRKPWIADLRDPWTEDCIGMWPSVFHRWLERRFARCALRRADQIINVGPTARQRILALLGIDMARRMPVITNGYDEEDFKEQPLSQSTAKAFTLVHVGAFGAGIEPCKRKGLHGLTDLIKTRPAGYDMTTYSARYLLQAIELLRQRYSIEGNDFRVEMVGFVPDDCRQQVRDLHLDGIVIMRGYKSHEEATKSLMAADLLWLPLPLPLDGKPLLRVSGKLFEYMRSGKPVLTLDSPGDAVNLLRKAGTGYFADPRNPEDIAHALLDLYSAHRNGGIKVQPNWAYIRQFERREVTRTLAGLFDQLSMRRSKQGGPAILSSSATPQKPAHE